MSEESFAAKVYRRATTDFPFFCEHFLRIRDKETKKMVPFLLNEPQLRTWRTIKTQLDKGKPAWILLLKARQQGSSTFAMALAAWVAFLRPEQTVLTVAHREKEGKEIFEKLERMWELMPREMRPPKASGCRAGDILKLGKPLNTTVIRDSAENVVIGRGLSPLFIHMTEMPSWPDPEKSLGGILPSVESISDGIIMVETTAEGMGDYFHRLWTEAEQGGGKFIPLFNAWFLSPEYAEEFTEDDDPLTDAEIAYGERFGLTPEQSLWHRKMLRQLGEERMGREYPSSPEEAFRASGTPYFDRSALTYYDDLVTKINKRGPLRQGYVEVQGQSGKTRFVTGGEESPWRIWERPDPSAKYVIAADPSGGTARDFSSIDVLEVSQLKQVASYRGKMDPDELAYQIAAMGYSYNTALAAVEKNGEGRATVLTLHKRLQYPRIFYHIREEAMGKGIATEFGWVTSTRTRPTMLAQLEELVRKREVRLRDPRTIREMWSFSRVDGAKLADAASGGYDDSVMSLAIACSSEVRAQAHSRSEILQSNYQPMVS